MNKTIKLTIASLVVALATTSVWPRRLTRRGAGWRKQQGPLLLIYPV